jgi:hypothetical protein
VVEEARIATVCVSTGRDLTALVRPPRSIFVNHPMGNAFGAPGDVATQLTVLRAALQLVETAQTPGLLVDLPCTWPEPFAFRPASG